MKKSLPQQGGATGSESNSGLSAEPFPSAIPQTHGQPKVLPFRRPKRSKPMQKITPFFWFDGKAEEAANFYTSIFKNSKIVYITQMSSTFQLDGLEFIAFNGGPMFTFSPAVSFFVRCETQQEIDYFWEKLSIGGEKQRCGWLKDKFGVSWQIIPPVLGDMLNDEDAEKSQRVMQAMLQMDKIEIKKLKQAYEGQ
jgi:predicted 3-demethylubiquinone-9 3-methyltransferase (glyoxalase superfamily)